MAFYIDSAFLHDIMNVAQTIPVAGVTTNPSILLAGSDDLTVTPGLLLDLLNDPLTEEALQRFTQDWQKMKKM